MSASNTFDCFRECVGLRVVGVIRNALPVGRVDLSKGTKTLIFEDGTGLTLSSNGSYWRENKHDIGRAIAEKQRELDDVGRELTETLAAAGATAPQETT